MVLDAFRYIFSNSMLSLEASFEHELCLKKKKNARKCNARQNCAELGIGRLDGVQKRCMLQCLSRKRVWKQWRQSKDIWQAFTG